MRRCRPPQPDTYFANLAVQRHGERGGDIERARAAFESIACRDAFSWNLMISAYTRHGCHQEALELYQRMPCDGEGVHPDKFTFLPALSSSGSLRSLLEGKAIHSRIVSAVSLLPSDVALNTALITMYGRCGCMASARAVFDTMSVRNVISWTAMIAAYAQNGHGQEALELFYEMEKKQMIKPDRVTFLCVIDACSGLASPAQGRAIHHHFASSHAYLTDVTIETAFVTMYGKLGAVDDSRGVFDGIPIPSRNVVSWNAMISVYVENKCWAEALDMFHRMDNGERGQGVVEPDRVTFLAALEACANVALLETGSKVHARVVASGLLEPAGDVAVETAIVSMYGKCGSLKDARVAFDGMRCRDTVAWTAMLSAYAGNGQGREALALLDEMTMQGFEPDRITFVAALEACASASSPAYLKKGREIHRRLLNTDGVDNNDDIIVETALLHMYAKCGSLVEARMIFDAMRKRDLVSWNAMIAAYAQSGDGKEALQLFRLMSSKGVKPDVLTFTSIIDSCATLSTLEHGRKIHEYLMLASTASEFKSDVTLKNALLNMYGKCGSVKYARVVFDNTEPRNSLSWNTMITAYVQNGYVKEALDLFQHMGFEGVAPDWVTHLNILNVCSHAGLRDEGWEHFVSVNLDYMRTQTAEHYVCLIDLLGRAGLVSEASDVMQNMPIAPDPMACTTFAWCLSYTHC